AGLGIEPGETVLGYVSSLTAPYEGIRYLIEAVVLLTRKGRPAKALIVGEGTERPHLMELAERLGVADRVIFTGRVDHTELPAHYSLIDVFVVPRTSEATTELVTPLKPYEAMAMGRAVLVSGTRALREMIIEGETGISYRPDDVEDMVARLEELIDDPGRMRELGTNAREWVTEHRSWDRNVEMYREVYAGLGLEIGAGASGSMSA
ncbi:MAG TPA: glycosyltransferase family 4 protein, partial [Solirubrobacterales bacterium]|nr:glycosyltransferase family 4 protein [Solirubrobacterales bacterium]